MHLYCNWWTSSSDIVLIKMKAILLMFLQLKWEKIFSIILVEFVSISAKRQVYKITGLSINNWKWLWKFWKKRVDKKCTNGGSKRREKEKREHSAKDSQLEVFQLWFSSKQSELVLFQYSTYGWKATKNCRKNVLWP